MFSTTDVIAFTVVFGMLALGLVILGLIIGCMLKYLGLTPEPTSKPTITEAYRKQRKP